MRTPERSQLLLNAKVRTDAVVRGLTKYLPHWPVPHVEVPIVACCVYRQKNSRHTERMIRQLPTRAEVRLHALGEPTSTLESFTLSIGPGPRMPLLQSLLDARPIPRGAWVIIFDDDVDFALGGRTAFVDLAVAAKFDIAGAAIDPRHPRTYGHTLVGRASIARTVGMVEVGPVIAFSPAALEFVLPFPKDSGMGWGLDIRWSQFPDLRRGYVDAYPIRHHGAVAAAYDTTQELERMEQEMASAGLTSPSEVSVTLEIWRPWQRQPPWLGHNGQLTLRRRDTPRPRKGTLPFTSDATE